MAVVEIHKCDRCGVQCDRMSHYNGWGYRPKDWDLCRACSLKFETWMRGHAEISFNGVPVFFDEEKTKPGFFGLQTDRLGIPKKIFVHPDDRPRLERMIGDL